MLELIEPLLEVRFRKVLITELNMPWYVALSKDKRECLALLPNETRNGQSIDPTMSDYEMFLYVVRSPREDQIVRLVARETRLRFVRPPDRIMEFCDQMLSNPDDAKSSTNQHNQF